MSLFSVSRAARADLKNIAAYTQKTWGAEQRKAYIKDLDLTFLFLAENPMSGTPCDYIISGLRKHSHESHTIFYE
ncbi:type II toxin-antitoxin system RelE/ParE family toxin, partial [Marinospirillum minutulum]|uniref:type II toxin-antitoxin system RelE/ParE family toxin n=1 Tax=Marinospirillum minutulum TaxID=64974 RepID=UPI000486DA99